MRLALTLAALLALPAQAEPVRLATEAAFAPYNYLDAQGEVAGFDREFGDEMCARAGLTCTWVVRDWDALIPELMAGNADVILAAMTITAERRAVIDFTQPYVPPAPSAYLGRPGTYLETALVAAQTGTVHADHVAASAATLVEFPTTDDVLAALRRGEVDAAFADQPFLEEAAGGDLVILRGGIPLGEGFGLGLRKSDAALRQRIDAAIGAMKQDGSLNALLLKWFGPGASTF